MENTQAVVPTIVETTTLQTGATSIYGIPKQVGSTSSIWRRTRMKRTIFLASLMLKLGYNLGETA